MQLLSRTEQARNHFLSEDSNWYMVCRGLLEFDESADFLTQDNSGSVTWKYSSQAISISPANVGIKFLQAMSSGLYTCRNPCLLHGVLLDPKQQIKTLQKS